MLFPTLDFGLFFLVAFALSWTAYPHPQGRKAILVAASYFFYGYWDWRFCFLLVASSLINYAAGRLLAASPQQRKTLVAAVAVGLNLIILGYFKYYGFFVESLNDLAFSLGLERELPFLEIILPVGISFFTFQGISYVVDVYRGHVAPSRSLLDILLYISFFPQLVAGPIVRASQFLPQIEGARGVGPDTRRILAGFGMLLILMGLFKKVVIANYLATEMVDDVFFDPFFYSAPDLLLGIYGYTIQIYCDFSAYSDIAIGVAALLGYRFQRNFDQPYRAQSVREFWRRWHISLSTWLRDYLYIPLGGSHRGANRTRLNLLITMLLGGLWHGAAWKYVLWGSMHGLALVAEQTFGWGNRSDRRPLAGRILAVFVVFHFLCLTFIVFRAEDMGIVRDYLVGFTNWDQPVQFLTPLIVGLLFVGMAVHFVPATALGRMEAAFCRLPLAIQGLLVGFGIVAIDAFGPEGVAPFIYFQF